MDHLIERGRGVDLKALAREDRDVVGLARVQTPVVVEDQVSDPKARTLVEQRTWSSRMIRCAL
jgi:hypothetical protein